MTGLYTITHLKNGKWELEINNTKMLFDSFDSALDHAENLVWENKSNDNQ